MLIKSSLSLPLSWKNLYRLKIIPQDMLDIKSSNFPQSILSKNLSNQTKEFRRLFTKSIIYDINPKQDYKKICEQGDIASIREYANLIISEDPTKAAYCYKIGSEKQDINCMYDYGICLYLGKGVKKDYSSAFKLFEEASQKGSSESDFCLYICYLYGQGVKSDKKKAEYYFQRSAPKDYFYSLTASSISLFFKDINKQQFYRQAAQQGEKHSEFFYGLSILFGAGHEDQDIKKGLYYLKKSADEGYSPSQERYGEFLLKGYFVDSDVKQSLKYLSLASEKNLYNACYLYSVALLIQENPDKMLAFKMMKKAADAGHIDAMIEIGKMLINGHVKDEEDSVSEGFKYIQGAVDKNSIDALILYAKLSEIKKKNKLSGIELDYIEKCYRKAAIIKNDDETINLYLDFLKRHNKLNEMEDFLLHKNILRMKMYDDWNDFNYALDMI